METTTSHWTERDEEMAVRTKVGLAMLETRTHSYWADEKRWLMNLQDRFVAMDKSLTEAQQSLKYLEQAFAAGKKRCKTWREKKSRLEELETGIIFLENMLVEFAVPPGLQDNRAINYLIEAYGSKEEAQKKTREQYNSLVDEYLTL